MNTVTSADGTAIAYDRAGTGESLVLVGGAFSYRRYPGQVKLAQLLSARSLSTAMTAAVAVTAVTAPGTP